MVLVRLKLDSCLDAPVAFPNSEGRKRLGGIPVGEEWFRERHESSRDEKERGTN